MMGWHLPSDRAKCLSSADAELSHACLGIGQGTYVMQMIDCHLLCYGTEHLCSVDDGPSPALRKDVAPV